jgi:thiamine pyrophosphokinase
MRTLILSGGQIAEEEVKKVLADVQSRGEKLMVIAADKGMEAADRLGICPDWIIGDFDSADQTMLEESRQLEKEGKSHLVLLNPIKDDTDSEAALHLAFRESEGEIDLFGGSGTRIDHLLSNLCMMKQGLEENRLIFLIDRNNRIRLMDASHPVSIAKKDQFGTYVSLIPLSGPAEGVTLKGFYYPLENATLSGRDSLGTSNEIVESVGEIRIRSGVCAVIESRD